jgi:hypothetical protein
VTDVLDIMRGTTTLSRRVTLCLDGTLQAEYDRLTSQLTEASLADRDSLAADQTRQVIDAMESVRERMIATEVSFTFKALPWKRRLALQAEHPPRDGNTIDNNSGHNVETYIPALIREACSSVVGADGVVIDNIPDEVWDAMLANLNFSQVDTLFSAAQNANDNATTVPLSARSLLETPNLGPSSNVPDGGASPPAGSKVGNPRRTRKSTTTKRAPSPVTPQPPNPNGTTTPVPKP